MPRIDYTVRVAGENGEGVNTVAETLATALTKAGLHVYFFQQLPAEIKGGASNAQVRFSNEPVYSGGDALNVLMAWNQENYDLHCHDVQKGGVIFYDPSECKPREDLDVQQVATPLNEIVDTTEGITRKSKNVVAFGFLTSYFGIPLEMAEQMIRESRWGRYKQFLPSNMKAVQTAYEYMQRHRVTNGTSFQLPAGERPPMLFMTGNQAVAMGAIAAGCQFMAGYPITPATDIMENLSKYLPQVGGLVLQCEDEIASLGAVIGASFAGKKAMTSTAGPGLSLMVEEIGLATMEELPLVIVDCQRGGPSTGLPTRTEQGDLDLAVYGRHGDAPRIVVAPYDVEDCFYATVQAFNLAEKYQVPVIVLSDYHLSQRAQPFPRPDVSKLEVLNRLTPQIGSNHYLRYRLTEDYISPMAIPGVHDTTYVATGLEHDEHAHIDYSPRMHTLMMEKRGQKVAQAAKEPGFVLRYGAEQADLGLICWGSTYGPVREAVDRAQEKGYKAAALFVKMVYPVQESAIQNFIDSAEQVAVVELNYSGQFCNLLQSTFCRPFMRLNKCNGLPFKSGEILDYIEKVLNGGNESIGQLVNWSIGQ
jgi:2-oxoglutarate ferredoxin oxidoreductase subunit alpha